MYLPVGENLAHFTACACSAYTHTFAGSARSRTTTLVPFAYSKKRPSGDADVTTAKPRSADGSGAMSPARGS
jgi:hypothetical protein